MSAIQVPETGQEIDPVFATLANAARFGDAEYAAAINWLEGERAKRRAKLEQHEAELAEFAAARQSEIASRHKSQIAWARRENL
jgi:hypothetical protein